MSRDPDILRAKKLRIGANTSEQKAWSVLRKFRALGYPIRRQHPVGGYIVDFACIKAKLAIEVDGSVHNREDVSARDAERQAHIEALGWRVLRIDSQIAMSADHLHALVVETLGL